MPRRGARRAPDRSAKGSVSPFSFGLAWRTRPDLLERLGLPMCPRRPSSRKVEIFGTSTGGAARLPLGGVRIRDLLMGLPGVHLEGPSEVKACSSMLLVPRGAMWTCEEPACGSDGRCGGRLGDYRSGQLPQFLQQAGQRGADAQFFISASVRPGHEVLKSCQLHQSIIDRLGCRDQLNRPPGEDVASVRRSFRGIGQATWALDRYAGASG